MQEKLESENLKPTDVVRLDDIGKMRFSNEKEDQKSYKLNWWLY